MKRIPPPPNTKRVPPPPVPKLPVKTFQQKLTSQHPSQNNQQQIQSTAQYTSSFPIQREIQSAVQSHNKDLNEKNKQQTSESGIKNVQNQQKIDYDQQGEIISNNQPAKIVEPRIAPVMKGLPPPPKSRNGVSQDKRRVNPPKIPAPNFIPRVQQTPQKDQNLTKNVTNPIDFHQNPINQNYQQKTQPQKINVQSQRKNIKLNVENAKNSLQKQSQKLTEIVSNQDRSQQIKNQQSPVKMIPTPPSFKPGNKKAPFQVKPPIKPPSAIKNVQTVNKQSQPIQIKYNDPKTQQRQYQNQKIPSVQKNENAKNAKNTYKINEKINLGKDKSLDKNQQRPSQIKQKEQTTQPKQYNELQQKLRRLQQLRSKMDQSSEEQYSNKQEDQIQQEEQLQISQNQSKEQQRNDDQILIVGERNVDTQIQPLQQETKDMKVNFESFAIGETNYEQMEIKQENPDIVDQIQVLNVQPPQVTVQDQAQQNSPNSSSPEEQSVSNVPVPAQTVYQSNLSVQQSQRQYLPDELSISPLNSQSSMQKHRQFLHDSANNVHHADKYHSQANFDKLRTVDKNTQQDQINQKLQDAAVSQKTDNQLSKHKNHSTKNQHHYQIRDQSIQSVYDKKSFDNDQENFKQNRYSKINLQNSQKLKPQTTQKNINNLLKQFKAKKTLYLQNIENLKIKQEKFNEQEIQYRQRINQLIDQVNHKNLLILKHATGLTDINIKNDKQIQTQEL